MKVEQLPSTYLAAASELENLITENECPLEAAERMTSIARDRLATCDVDMLIKYPVVNVIHAFPFDDDEETIEHDSDLDEECWRLGLAGSLRADKLRKH